MLVQLLRMRLSSTFHRCYFVLRSTSVDLACPHARFSPVSKTVLNPELLRCGVTYRPQHPLSCNNPRKYTFSVKSRRRLQKGRWRRLKIRPRYGSSFLLVLVLKFRCLVISARQIYVNRRNQRRFSCAQSTTNPYKKCFQTSRTTPTKCPSQLQYHPSHIFHRQECKQDKAYKWKEGAA
jgi:hypothetical protein